MWGEITIPRFARDCDLAGSSWFRYQALRLRQCSGAPARARLFLFSTGRYSKLTGMSSVTRAVLACAAAVALCACGSAAPLQSTQPAPTRTATPAGVGVTAIVPVVTAAETATLGPSPTVNSPATSRAVILTITALAATPTYPPTSTPRPTRIYVGAGPEDVVATPNPAFVGVVARPLATQVARGGVAAMTIRAQPGAVCGLWALASPGSQRRAIPGVTAGQTAGDGMLAWIWNIADDAQPGALDLLVDCGPAGSAAVRIDVLR